MPSTPLRRGSRPDRHEQGGCLLQRRPPAWRACASNERRWVREAVTTLWCDARSAQRVAAALGSLPARLNARHRSPEIATWTASGVKLTRCEEDTSHGPATISAAPEGGVALNIAISAATASAPISVKYRARALLRLEMTSATCSAVLAKVEGAQGGAAARQRAHVSRRRVRETLHPYKGFGRRARARSRAAPRYRWRAQARGCLAALPAARGAESSCFAAEAAP